MAKLPRSERANTPPRHDEVLREAGLGPGLQGLRDLVDRLLAEDGCPWDRAQTLDSLRPYLLEETHEVLDAMDDPVAHAQELGDLLFQIVFQAALREREGVFDLDVVIEGIVRKLVRRHPHVFARQPGQPVPTPAEVAATWEQIKQAERGEPSGAPDPLAGIPSGLPALARAAALQRKAAGVGFDWSSVQGALDKLDEELRELEEARQSNDRSAMQEEYGDLLFVLVRVGQKLGLDAEDALGRANEKFRTRFAHMMKRCDEAGLDPAKAGLARLEQWWAEAKVQARSGSDSSGSNDT